MNINSDPTTEDPAKLSFKSGKKHVSEICIKIQKSLPLKSYIEFLVTNNPL